MRFGSEPETEVGFHGSPGRESVSHSERKNLPDQVEAGTDYRDVRVDYRLATRLCRRTNRSSPPGA
jgi:hypothetical protein